MFLEKLLGVGIIIISFVVLALISYFDPPTLVQIICAFAGSFICLIGIVITFAEYPIWIKKRWGKTEKAPDAARTPRVTIS
jgi:hypothetical protein